MNTYPLSKFIYMYILYTIVHISFYIAFPVKSIIFFYSIARRLVLDINKYIDCLMAARDSRSCPPTLSHNSIGIGTFDHK